MFRAIALVLGLVLVQAPLAAQQQRGIKINFKESTNPNAAVAGSVTLYEKSYALVIGIDAYTGGWPPLDKAVEDARAVAKALRAQDFDVTERYDLTSRELTRALEDFYYDKGADPNARLFVWFAGHGYTNDRGQGYLVPADAPLPSDRRGFLRTALNMTDFEKFVLSAESKHAFAVFDACFAGTIFETTRDAPPTAITRATTLPVRQFLTSGDANQTVADDGTFRRLFIDAVTGERSADANGDGYLTASELGLFMDDRVTNYTDAKQTPRYGKLNDPDYDRGDFVFVLPGTTVTAVSTGSGSAAFTSAQIDRLQGQLAALGYSVAQSGRLDVDTIAAAKQFEQDNRIEGLEMTPAAIGAAVADAYSRADRRAWQRAKTSHDLALYEDYLSRFPDGQYGNLARASLAVVPAFDKAFESGSVDALVDFASAHPNSPLARDGAIQMAAVRQAGMVNTDAAYGAVYRQFPNSRVRTALDHMKALKALDGEGDPSPLFEFAADKARSPIAGQIERQVVIGADRVANAHYQALLQARNQGQPTGGAEIRIQRVFDRAETSLREYGDLDELAAMRAAWAAIMKDDYDALYAIPRRWPGTLAARDNANFVYAAMGKSATVDELERFLDRYPNHAKAGEVKAAIPKIRLEQETAKLEQLREAGLWHPAAATEKRLAVMDFRDFREKAPLINRLLEDRVQEMWIAREKAAEIYQIDIQVAKTPAEQRQVVARANAMIEKPVRKLLELYTSPGLRKMYAKEFNKPGLANTIVDLMLQIGGNTDAAADVCATVIKEARDLHPSLVFTCRKKLMEIRFRDGDTQGAMQQLQAAKQLFHPDQVGAS